MKFVYGQADLGNGYQEHIVFVEKEQGLRCVAKGKTKSEALQVALLKFEIKILDKCDFPPGKIASLAGNNPNRNLIRNIAVLRTQLHSLYEEVKRLETSFPPGPHSAQDFGVSGTLALLAGKFDWFSVGMLNLMEGISLIDTLMYETDPYSVLAECSEWMQSLRKRAREYTASIPEATALRVWRDKVAAHRSGIVPPPGGKSTDSVTAKLISLSGATVMAKNGRYVAPAAMPFGRWDSFSDNELK